MRCVAALPSIALLSGAACGLLVDDPPFVVVSASLTLSACAAAWSFAARRDVVLCAAVAAGFFAGGVLLASVAWQRAWRPPLRIAFEELARVERADAEREGRRLPEDAGAFAIVLMKVVPQVPGSFTAAEWIAFTGWSALGLLFWFLRPRPAAS